ncbi:MAG: nucleoside triphosphate pyrophosphohydrolase [Novosphingobium sp.]|nr:nucleoside triphosphate pyrophosphohydrolase [Novosphingobium sp.]
MRPIDRLISIMATLRDPRHGCEWDREQTFGSIAPYTIEEAYEVADAIMRGDMVGLRDELGDLLLQTVFHARMAEEAGYFAFDDVARSIADKLQARHPHIFGSDTDAGPVSQRERWEMLKAGERAAKGVNGALDGVAQALPALMRAEKLQKRAARVGFDWPDASGPADKVREELDELWDAREDQRLEEAGDLLFAAVNLVRKMGVAPEDALRAANAKFERRFAAMEAMVRADARDFASLTLEEQDALWAEAKRSETAKPA